ncbi:hypothetical protein SAMN03159496_03142 [Rhizobium sp. NFR07]|nr:hypothetical protein SAMN03159496_03142 [Rhizobium sp. NFR07]
MRMMGGLSGTPSAPDKLSVADYAFLFLPGNEDLINDMNDLEESAITLTDAVSEFTVRNMQFGEILVKMSDGKPTVEGKSILVERMPGETHILEIQMRDLLAQIRFLLDRLSDLPERTVQNFVDHAHGHFGKSFRQFQYRVKPATPTVS